MQTSLYWLEVDSGHMLESNFPNRVINNKYQKKKTIEKLLLPNELSLNFNFIYKS